MGRTYIKKAIKEKVVEIADERCEYCKSLDSFTTELFTIDHIIPISQNGTNDFENLAYCCSGSNTFKSDVTSVIIPNTKEPIFLFHPREQKWEEHFAWSDDFLTLIGKTITGIITIEMLRLNRMPLQNLRRVLLMVGKHPPK